MRPISPEIQRDPVETILDSSLPYFNRHVLADEVMRGRNADDLYRLQWGLSTRLVELALAGDQESRRERNGLSMLLRETLMPGSKASW